MKSSSKKIEILIALVAFVQFSSAEVPDRIKIESQLANVTMDLISMEANLTKKLTNFGLQAKFCSSNLKASNLSKNFTDVLDNLMTFIQQVQTVKDHQIQDLPLDVLSAYDYTQFQIATSFSDIKYFKAIIRNILTNTTKLNEFAGNVTKHYKQNYMKFVVLKSKDKTVMATIREFFVIYREFGGYIQHLNTHIGNLMKTNAYLSNLIVSKTVIPPSNSSTSSFMAKVRSIESTLVSPQQQLITTSKVASRKVTEALKAVSSQRTKRSSESSSEILSDIKECLDGIATTNDYSLVGWPQLPDLPADGKTKSIKLRSSVCDTKERNFEDTNDLIQQNQTKIDHNRDFLKESTSVATSNTQRKVQAQSQQILDVLGALGKVDDAFVNYKVKVDLAIIEIRNLRDEVNIPPTTTTTTTTLAPITTTTKAPTTTTIITTTTKFVLPPCGTFIPYDPVSDKDAPFRYGILAGTYNDGSPIYVGRGDNSAYLGMNQTSARVSIDATKPGLYMTTSSGEVFSNTKAFFLANHTSIMWIKVTAATSFTHPYAIKWMSGSYPMLFGRVTVAGYTAVGRVHYGNGLLGLHIYRPDLNQVVVLGPTEEFEIVACKTSDCGCFDDESFDSTLKINLPFTYALPAGIHYDGSIAYIAQVTNTECFESNIGIARVSINPSKPGAFMACGNATHGSELFFNFSTAIQLKGNTIHLVWRKTNGTHARNVPGLHYYDPGPDYMAYGRYQINNYTVIGNVRILTTPDREGFYGWNPESNTFFKLAPAEEFEVLACV